MRASLGNTMVWTRFPLIMRRISIESVVKAKMYGKAHTVMKSSFLRVRTSHYIITHITRTEYLKTATKWNQCIACIKEFTAFKTYHSKWQEKSCFNLRISIIKMNILCPVSKATFPDLGNIGAGQNNGNTTDTTHIFLFIWC
jgi:hypothetical protein